MTPSEAACPSQLSVLHELDTLAPGAPFLALGQTVFWDEPMKAMVGRTAREAGLDRAFVAGAHDTDYFAKIALPRTEKGFRALAHNDTTTQALWSAAGEFSSLFGSETVVTRERLQAAGVRLARVQRARPGVLDEATEAYGWRGVVAIGDESPVVADMALESVQGPLLDTLRWAVEETISLLPTTEEGSANARHLLEVAERATRGARTLSDFYRQLLPILHEFVSGEPAGIRTTATSELLKFNTLTCHQDRFEILNQFLNPLSRTGAVRAYNETVAGSEVYTLDRFGSWAIPFDLVVPGHGRGTLRIAPKAVVIMTPTPLFITLRTPITSVRELAQAIENKFGPDCVVVGKAITLIGMLAREFVFVFHEGASSYVGKSRALHEKIYGKTPEKPFHPILRVRMNTWDALSECRSWIKLPEPFQQPFGAEEMCTPSFAGRWREVVRAQKDLLRKLSELRSPLALIRWLAGSGLTQWETVAQEYERLNGRLESLHQDLDALRKRKEQARAVVRELKSEVNRLEHEKGKHWRDAIFEHQPSAAELDERNRQLMEIEEKRAELATAIATWRGLIAEQAALVRSDAIMAVHARRRDIEFELELKRLKLARNAITTSDGLMHANFRPSAWWFPLVCPDGGWFRETARTAEYYLEAL